MAKRGEVPPPAAPRSDRKDATWSAASEYVAMRVS
jgi:hypothetical protein